MAGPAPCYDGPLPGQLAMRITVSGPGWGHTIVCTVPMETARNRPRSDQYAVEIDGAPWAELAGKIAILAELISMLPRALSRRTIATLQR